jgi:ribosomal protein L31
MDFDDLDNFFSEIAAVEEPASEDNANKKQRLEATSSTTVKASTTVTSTSVTSAFVPKVVSMTLPVEVTKASHPVYTYTETFEETAAPIEPVSQSLYSNPTVTVVEDNSLLQFFQRGGNSASSSSSSFGGFNVAPTVSYTTTAAPPKPPPPSNDPERKFVRKGADCVWIDDSLKEWPDNDYRIFVGDIAKEITTDQLAKQFVHYKSYAKAKVCRTKHENKARGFGFVSFMDPMDCAKAIREMQGKYLGSRPMKITKSTWKDRDLKVVQKKEKKRKKLEETLGLV